MTVLKTEDLSKILKSYSNIWLAIDPGTMKVVAKGKTPNIVIDKARKLGIKHPTITKAPKDYGTFVL